MSTGYEEKLPTYEEQVRDLHDLQELVESRGWALLMQAAEGQKKSRQHRVMLTPVSAEYPVGMEQFEKGEVAGIMLFQDLPHTAIEDLQVAVEYARQQMEANDNEVNENGDGTERNAP